MLEKAKYGATQITIYFGNRAVPGRAVVPVPGRITCLRETQAALVLSQTVSGAITAVIYPPASGVSKPDKPYYVIAIELDPRNVTRNWVQKLLALTFEVDIFCGARNFPNRLGGRLMAKLRARDAVLAEGGSRLWVWIKYVYSTATGVLRLYGIGKPTGL